MTPGSFKATFVDDNVLEFLAEPNNVRRNAIWAFDALVAHIYRSAKVMVPDLMRRFKNDDEYRNALAAEDEPYAVLRDAANALKHAQLTRTKEPRVKFSESFASLGVFQANTFQQNAVQRRQVFVETTPPRRVYPVAYIIAEVLAKLASEMERLGAP